jgi:hypothetical protein
MTALLSSFKEAKQALSDQGIELGVKVIRKLAYRYLHSALLEGNFLELIYFVFQRVKTSFPRLS